MTDPVILLGTQSNGETLPVQVNEFGQLVAEGLTGEEGPQGPEGPEGPPGQIDLPPDPYEGALLGWLNGGLAWVGSEPVPIPPGVFGPIVSFDSDNGYVEVAGEVPAQVQNGVYIWQCDEQGVRFTTGWDTSETWSNGVVNPSGYLPSNPAKYMFDGNPDTVARPSGGGAPISINFNDYVVRNDIKIHGGPGGDGTGRITATINEGLSSELVFSWTGNEYTQGSTPFYGTLKTLKLNDNNNTFPHCGEIVIDGRPLVDPDESLNMRVNQIFGNGIIGVASTDVDFVVGAYLIIPDQRVAPWVLYGNDPTSLIDHLRSS